MTSVADPSVAEEILNAPLDKVLVKPLERKPARSWPKKSLIKGRKNALATVGINLSEGDPDYIKCLRLSDNYRKHRARELVVVHGFVSAGVSSLLSSAALALAASRYLYERAGKDGDVSLLITASKLADSARQSELAAWELCKKESVDRRKAAAAQEGAPWLVPPEGPGRPKAAKKVQEAHVVDGYYSPSSPTPDSETAATDTDVDIGPGEPASGPAASEPGTGPESDRDS